MHRIYFVNICGAAGTEDTDEQRQSDRNFGGGNSDNKEADNLPVYVSLLDHAPLSREGDQREVG
jgi:hypothetical protein